MNSPKVNSDRASPKTKRSRNFHARQKATPSAKQSAGIAWAQLSKYQNPGLDTPVQLLSLGGTISSDWPAQAL